MHACDPTVEDHVLLYRMRQYTPNRLPLLLPHAATCRLGWYTAQPPRYTGNTVLCSGSSMENCLEPCLAGYDQLQNSSLCMQRCPDEAVGPAQLCPVSRTCIRAAGVCPMLSEVPYICPVPDQFLGEWASYGHSLIPAVQQLLGLRLAHDSYSANSQCNGPLLSYTRDRVLLLTCLHDYAAALMQANCGNAACRNLCKAVVPGSGGHTASSWAAVQRHTVQGT